MIFNNSDSEKLSSNGSGEYILSPFHPFSSEKYIFRLVAVVISIPAHMCSRNRSSSIHHVVPIRIAHARLMTLFI